jgi:hypothetical protein
LAILPAMLPASLAFESRSVKDVFIKVIEVEPRTAKLDPLDIHVVDPDDLETMFGL